MQNEEHQVRGVVGRIVQREPHTLEEAKNMTDHQLNYEIMRIDNSDNEFGYESPSTSIVDLSVCVSNANKHPPESSDVGELVKCAQMMLRCRTMFQRSQFNDVVEFLTPKLLQKTFPNYLR